MIQWNPSTRRPERRLKSSRKILAGPPLILSGAFVLLIVLGMFLLKLPVATTSPISWMESLFTATSAVTVTGLVVLDTGTDFTLFGQLVIALLIQLGGLGLMTFAVVTLIALGGKIGFIQQTVVKEAFNQTDMSTLVNTAKSVFWFSLIVESIGMLVLTLYWLPQLGWETSLWHGFFYTISAFNNAGFALSADSLTPYVSDPVVSIMITALFITGGLGFTVWMDMWRQRKWRQLSVYSRLMLMGTLVINVVAVIVIYCIEYDNPETLGSLDAAGKWLAAWFQGVTPRTAGFNTLPIHELEDSTTALTLLLMFIGGGSLSTASGVKVVTIIVLVLATYSFLRRRDDEVTVYGRRITLETVRKALSLTIISAGICWLAIFLLLLTEKASFLDIVFEVVSAFSTVGLSRGLTGSLSAAGEVIIIFLMFVGRLGPLTLAYFLASSKKRAISHPETNITVG